MLEEKEGMTKLSSLFFLQGASGGGVGEEGAVMTVPDLIQTATI